MMRRFESHLSFSNVVAVVALFIAIGGSAYAVGITKNSVGTKTIKDRSIRDIDVKHDALTGRSIEEASLAGVDADLLNGQSASSFLPAGTPVPDSAKLGGKLPAEYLGSNAQATDSAKLGGNLPSAYLGSDAQAADSAQLGGKSASEYLRGQVVSLTAPRGFASLDGPVVGGVQLRFSCSPFRLQMRLRNTTGTQGTITTSYLRGSATPTLARFTDDNGGGGVVWLDTLDNVGGTGNEDGSGTFVWTNGATVVTANFEYLANASVCEFYGTMHTGT